MKKIILFLLVLCNFFGCATVKEAETLANCKFALQSVELTDYNLTTLGFDVTIAITNSSKTQKASLKKFVGKLTVNGTYMADITLTDVVIEPNSVKQEKAKLTVPFASFSSKILGLLSMNSGTLDYHLTGTMYFAGPLGIEIPIAVDVGRIGSSN